MTRSQASHWSKKKFLNSTKKWSASVERFSVSRMRDFFWLSWDFFFFTNERPGIWSCDLWANERPQNKFHSHRQTDVGTDIATLWLNRPKGRFSEKWTHIIFTQFVNVSVSYCSANDIMSVCPKIFSEILLLHSTENGQVEDNNWQLTVYHLTVDSWPLTIDDDWELKFNIKSETVDRWQLTVDSWQLTFAQ